MSRCPHCGGTHSAENHFCPVSGKPIDLGPRLIGQRLLDRFRIVTILGEGPIGMVVEVEDVTKGRRLAAKLIHPQYCRNVEAANKLLEEARRTSTLGCAHIAEVVEVGRDTGAALTVVRELMTGKCLEAYIAEVRQLSFDESIKITREILLALEAIHGAGILNLDLSPADVFLAHSTRGEIAKLVDIGERHIKQSLPTQAEDNLASRSYWAPEQFDRSRAPNVKADIYAAGAILYEMLTGEIPKGDPAPVASLRPDVPPWLAQVAHKALAPTPTARFQTAAELIAALDSAGQAAAGLPQPAVGLAAVAPPVPVREEPVRPAPVQAPPAPSAPAAPAVEQPSVIVDMPEMRKGKPFLRSKAFIGAVAAVVVVGVVAVVLSMNGITPETAKPAVEAPAKITITINVIPKNAAISVDGRRVHGNPAKVEVAPDGALHTVGAKADGFEPLERDVAFDATKTVELALVEIVGPDGEQPAKPVVQPTADIEEIKDEGPAPAPASPEPVAAEPAPPPEPPKAAVKAPPAAAPKKPKAPDGEQPAAPKKPTKAAKPAPAGSDKKKTREGFNASNPFG